jgi:hypothetical protein
MKSRCLICFTAITAPVQLQTEPDEDVTRMKDFPKELQQGP